MPPGCGKPIVIPRTPENAALICAKIAEGLTLNQIALDMGAAGRSTILMWVAQDKEFAEQYRLAKMAQADHFAEEIIEIADDGSNDWIEREGQRGTIYQVVDKEAVMRSKLRVDTRLRLMASFAPKKYGAKVEVEHDVSDAFAERLVKARERAALALAEPLIIENE